MRHATVETVFASTRSTGAAERWHGNYRMDHDDARTTQWGWAPVGKSFHEHEKYGDLLFVDR